MIVGIVVAAVFLLVGSAGTAWWCIVKQKEKRAIIGLVNVQVQEARPVRQVALPVASVATGKSYAATMRERRTQSEKDSAESMRRNLSKRVM